MILITIILISFGFSDYLGGYPGAGFRYATNARDMSLGNSLISEYNDGFNAFSNPALLSKIDDLEIGASYFPMSMDRYVQVFSISQKLADSGNPEIGSAGASLSILNSGVSRIEGKDFYNESTGLFGSNEGYLMLSFGGEFSDQFSFGLNIKSIFNSIDDYSATGISGDIGMLYKASDKLIISALINDIIGEYTWDGIGSSASFNEQLPMTSSIGISFNVNDNINLFSRFDYMKPEDINLFRLRTGLELLYKSNALRFGLIQNQGFSNDDSFNFKFLMGVGTNIEVMGKYNMQLDYCIDFGKENEGISNLFSISFVQ